MKIENILPADIERRSMEIIESEIGDMSAFSEHERLIVKRCVHTTADFDYKNNLRFSDNAAEIGIAALKAGAVIITDTQMALSGISKPACKKLGCELHCFMSDPDVAEKAKSQGMRRENSARPRSIANPPACVKKPFPIHRARFDRPSLSFSFKVYIR